MSQELRNALYGVAAAVGVLLVVIGKADDDTVNAALELVGQILTLVSTGLAFWFSRPKKYVVEKKDSEV